MALVDAGLGELPVHVPRCLLIGETVTHAVGHLLYAALHRGQKDDVVQMIHCRLGSEVGKEPWPENTVDFPAPGGPVTTTREAMDGLSPGSEARIPH